MPENSLFRTTYIHKQAVKTMISYSASHQVGVNFAQTDNDKMRATNVSYALKIVIL